MNNIDEPKVIKTHFYLARHGETQWNRVKRFQGRLDSELTERGKRQSIQLAQQLTHKAIDHIFCSPLGRAQATAQLCQKALPVEVTTDSTLMERDLGAWQGQYLHEIAHHRHFDEILHGFTELTPVDGESAVACGERLYQSLCRIASMRLNQQVLIIFHGEALRCLLSSLGQSLDGNAYELFKNASVIELSYCHQSKMLLLPPA